MNRAKNDNFENYRRERERRRRQGDDTKKAGQSDALRELQQVEAKEERDRQLSRDVHEFFETATRTAANIVQKVSDTAKVEVDERLRKEMEDFLLDSLTRMQDLVAAVVVRNHGTFAEEEIEPRMRNLVGQLLDGFRSAGTAGSNKHLGEDPLATNLDAVCREFRAQIPQAKDGENLRPQTASGPSTAPPDGTTIEDHLVAELHGGDKGSPDLKRFKETLKTMVRQGTMTRAEARAAWQARLGGKS